MTLPSVKTLQNTILIINKIKLYKNYVIFLSMIFMYNKLLFNVD